jgi:Arc/MetJ-type ribon-helix-helix transcriptional regulator
MVYGWLKDGAWMVKTPLAETRRKESESEKITINLGFVDLGHIDLLVEEGFYSNRTDFIRTAIRNQVLTHGEVLKKSVARRSMVLGLQRYTRQDLENVLASGEQLHIHVLGLATIDDDVPAQLALRAIASVVVLGALRASREVKAALADRIR